MDIDATRWTNCFADVASAGHRRAVASYMREVVDPSLAALTAQVGAWAASTEGWAPFAHEDASGLLRATTEAYCLSIQSLWERQLRGYLNGCARHLRKDEKLAVKVMSAKWEELVRLFVDLRGIPLEEFESFPDLNLLQLVGNACRHGDGTSARKLFELCPEFWPQLSYAPQIGVLGAADNASVVTAPSFSSARIPALILSEFANAIAWFWDDAEYIYINSLERKHPSVYRTLERMRANREARRKLGPNKLRVAAVFLSPKSYKAFVRKP